MLQEVEGGTDSCATDIYWVKGRDIAKHLTMHKTGVQSKESSQMSTVPTLRNSDKEDPAENAEALGDGGATKRKDPVSLSHNKRGGPPNTHTEV